MSSFPVRIRSGLAKGARWTAFPVSGYWRGNVERDIEDAIRQYVQPGAACWDLGTHFGIYTLGMALRVGPAGQVAGFEPSPMAFAKCSRHVRMNRITNVKLFNAAVSNISRTGQMILAGGDWAATSHLPLEDQDWRDMQFGEASARRVDVQELKLDDLVDSGQIRAPDFIKVDVEGHGAKALAGALRAIARARPVIAMSFHSSWELDGTREALLPLGYSADWDQALYKTAILLPAAKNSSGSLPASERGDSPG
ncbi:MAG TPA: FkbM family methyltransferase [Pirellulales bacterium]|nr:FkbM family methyltransferase [Pirellulales bacterium]